VQVESVSKSRTRSLRRADARALRKSPQSIGRERQESRGEPFEAGDPHWVEEAPRTIVVSSSSEWQSKAENKSPRRTRHAACLNIAALVASGGSPSLSPSGTRRSSRGNPRSSPDGETLPPPLLVCQAPWTLRHDTPVGSSPIVVPSFSSFRGKRGDAPQGQPGRPGSEDGPSVRRSARGAPEAEEPPRSKEESAARPLWSWWWFEHDGWLPLRAEI
jgi:hypothetical protein